MKRSVPFALVLGLAAACGGGAPTSRAAVSPILSGDTCALHLDAVSCRADVLGCSWYPNTRACAVGAPCPPGWCSAPVAADGGTGGTGNDGGASASAGCACPGPGGALCVEELGGPAAPAQPAITCQAVPASCAAADRCGCLSSAALGACAASPQVTGLCLCDDGLR